MSACRSGIVLVQYIVLYLCRGEWTRNSRFIVPNVRGTTRRVDLDVTNLHVSHPFSDLTYDVLIWLHSSPNLGRVYQHDQ